MLGRLYFGVDVGIGEKCFVCIGEIRDVTIQLESTARGMNDWRTKMRAGNPKIFVQRRRPNNTLDVLVKRAIGKKCYTRRYERIRRELRRG